MNEIQLSLLGLGIGALLLVVAYNRWLERKYRKANAPEPVATAPEEDAASADSGRQEPHWDHADGAAIDTAQSEPALSDRQTSAESSASSPEPLAALTEVETWVDAIATIRFYEPRSAGSIRETVEQMGTQRFERIEFYAADAWHRSDALAADTLVSNLRCRLQLASRRGPIAPETLNDWMRSVESLAHVLSAGLSVEAESSILERANNLDAFCVRVDTLISLNLRPREAVVTALNVLTQQAAALNLSGDFPAYVRLNASGDVDFQVVADQGSGLFSLVMDFPQVLRPDAVVTDMLDLARTLSAALNADIVDDAARPLGEDGMAVLVHQVVKLNAMLQAQGIEAGSPLARRLFS